MKKTLTTVAILAIIVAGTQVHADQINGQHVTPIDANHEKSDDGTTWVQDGGTWWHNTEAHESGTVAPDPQPQPEPQTPEPPKQIEPPKVLPEQQTPTPQNPNAGAHLDAPQHIEKAPKPIGQKTQQPTTATDLTEETTDGDAVATITITEPKTKDVTGAHKSASADIEKLAIKDIEKAQNEVQATTATAKVEVVTTTLGTSTKSIDVAHPMSMYQAKNMALPATGENDTATDILVGIGFIIGATTLALYLKRKGA